MSRRLEVRVGVVRALHLRVGGLTLCGRPVRGLASPALSADVWDQLAAAAALAASPLRRPRPDRRCLLCRRAERCARRIEASP